MNVRKSRNDFQPCSFRDLGKGPEGFIAWCNTLITIQMDAIENVAAEQRAKSKASSDARKGDTERLNTALSAERVARAHEMIRAAALVAKQKRLGK